MDDKPTQILERRCPHCGWFLVKLKITRAAKDSDVELEVHTRCPNRNCANKKHSGLAHHDDFTVRAADKIERVARKQSVDTTASPR